ncbi:RluA family pseudouridine synthase [Inquilinus limosus]|uniref:RNA pseudouridine synthase n=1 Tax=Inquilinus limosus TaxID=171674 RepID=A0A211ZP47_9PROT|nr:RNA pseudouridine synthase [Inquilinus limosus]OWJ67019.1 RNA pseudouridine synthase [Inquilinus limosus]
MIAAPTPVLTDAEILARLLYRDGLMLILDKPAGLPVHAGPKGGPVLDHHLDALRFGLPHPPALAHRLDKDTSGCLVLGRHRKATATLGELFASGKVSKTYWAVVEGGPAQDEGRIDLPLAKRSAQRGWWMKVDPAGQPAQSEFRVLGRAGGLAWLELRPLTGRTHQLRLHCSASGFPILGDAIYGTAGRGPEAPPLHLHAHAVSVPLYPKKPPVAAEAAAPPHLAETLRRFDPRPAG